ncbi:hypothetical protein [Actinosynnema sp. NPDC023587]|uniref:hypothetical protein n=1 Tax=Actinosynnema sp. NPDC023587 TaxID=3154695 RepID=UPI0033DD2318
MGDKQMTPRTTALAAALALVASLLTATGAATAAPARDIGVGLPAVVDAAKAKAGAEHPDAGFYGVAAELDQPPVTEVDGIRGWRVHFTVHQQTNGFTYVYDVDGGYRRTEDWIPVGMYGLVDPFTMVEEKALAVLRLNGFRQPFSELVLVQRREVDTEPVYFFCLEGEGQDRATGVGTNTQNVYPDQFDCNT